MMILMVMMMMVMLMVMMMMILMLILDLYYISSLYRADVSDILVCEYGFRELGLMNMTKEALAPFKESASLVK